MMRLLDGNAKPLFKMAERTRSLASRTSVSAKPTNANWGKPLAKCTSTVTAGARKPQTVQLCTCAYAI
jgi:hypothetical protein